MSRSKIYIVSMVVIMVLLMAAVPALAQCPMCKASVESSLQSGSRVGIGINRGILYLLGAPYLFFTIIFFAWYYTNKKNKQLAK